MAVSKLVMALFKNRVAAEAALREISYWGYSPNEISILMSAAAQVKEPGIEDSTQVLEGVAVGAAAGATLGALFTGAIAVGASLVVPGIGLAVAGPLAATLAGAGTGGLTGGAVGALIGAGIPEKSARAYDRGIREGGILLVVQARSDVHAENLEEVFEKLGAEQVTEDEGAKS